MFCTNCGAQILPGDGFCTSCGAPIAANSSTGRPPAAGSSQSATGYQPASNMNQGAAGVRPVRGAHREPRPTVQRPQPAPEPAPRRHRNAGFIILLVAVLLIGCAGGAYLFLRFRSSQAAEEEEATTVLYASTDTLSLTTETVIEVYDIDDEELDEFTVYIEAEAVEAELSWTGASVKVSGTNEFTMAAFTEIEPGTYSMSIVDTQRDETYQCPDVEVLEDGSASSGAPERVALMADPDDPESAIAESVEYAATQITTEVSITYRDNESETTYEEEWTYPAFSSSEENNALDALNESIAEACEERLEETKAWTSDASTTVCLQYRAVATFLDGNIASVRYEIFETTWDGDDETTVTGAIYDLKSGSRVTVESVYDLSSSELHELAAAAIETYLATNPSDLYTASELEDVIDDIVSSTSRYYICEEGLVVVAATGELGSDSYGRHEIVVVAASSEDDSIVGTDVKSSYSTR